MASIVSMLPKPKHTQAKYDSDDSDDELESTFQAKITNPIPAYGKRKDWVPRVAADFGDGGAFPEIPVAQFPLNMGKKDKAGVSTAIVPLQLDGSGKVQYDAILRQGMAKDQIVHSSYDDLMPVDITRNDPRRELPSEDLIKETAERTSAAFEKLVTGKLAVAQATNVVQANKDATYIRYTPANQGEAYNSGAQQRVIRLVDVQLDPMEPPKFKTNKKIPRGPPSPPVPVLHSPPRKVSIEEQTGWKIPPSVSNWKNARGYIIPLDKRQATDGRGLQDVQINDSFAKLTEALYIAERVNREAIEVRAQIQRKAAQKEKERKEDALRNLAQKARDERSGIKPSAAEAEEVKERDDIRHDRQKERERDRRIQAAAPDKRSRLQRDADRDISEKIALGMPQMNTGGGGGFDSRLFNQTQGMASGFREDDSYDVYDKPFRAEKPTGIYRPTKNKDEYTEEDLEKLKTSDRFRPDKGFVGTEGGSSGARSGPVQFEKAIMAEDDVFGIDKFLTDAKEGSSARKRKGDGDDFADDKRRRN